MSSTSSTDFQSAPKGTGSRRGKRSAGSETACGVAREIVIGGWAMEHVAEVFCLSCVAGSWAAHE